MDNTRWIQSSVKEGREAEGVPSSVCRVFPQQVTSILRPEFLPSSFQADELGCG